MIKRILCWTQRLLLTGGALALGYCAFVLGDSWLFQRRARQEFERRLRERPVRSAGPETAPAASIGADGLIGRINIPRLGLSAVVFEGTDKLTLRRAVGHITSTSLPGQPGNVGLAGHRDSFFSPLKVYRERRPHHGHDAKRRIPIPCRVHSNRSADGGLRIASRRRRRPHAGHLLSPQFCGTGPRTVYRTGQADASFRGAHAGDRTRT